MKKSVFWFRRDLRLDDNAGLYQALKESHQVIPIFIFDSKILSQVQNRSDARVDFIYSNLVKLKSDLQNKGSDLLVYHGDPIEIVPLLIRDHNAEALYFNHDYEPYPLKRDGHISNELKSKGVAVYSFKDQVVFEKKEILTQKGQPYTVFTPYKKMWMEKVKDDFYFKSYPSEKYLKNLFRFSTKQAMMSLEDLGFATTHGLIKSSWPSELLLANYSKNRDIPFLDATTHMGPDLRFGTISVRELARFSKSKSEVYLSELVWRDFFSQILFNFPHVAKHSFRQEYDNLPWRESESDFLRWSQGQTGYPLVDAGMRELLSTGYIHNRVRMVVASFLTKHLLIHWRKGERFFSQYLNDYDMSSNNGNWQWCASTGCDAAPYYRVFNPELQQKRFDPELKYIKKWVPEYGSAEYVKPIVEHNFARQRVLKFFSDLKKEGL